MVTSGLLTQTFTKKKRFGIVAFVIRKGHYAITVELGVLNV